MRISTEPNISIGKRIAMLRKENGMRQEDLAEKLDISIKHMSEVERGLTCLSIEKLISVCDFVSFLRKNIGQTFSPDPSVLICTLVFIII